MKLLFLSNLYPPHDIGGYEQLCHEVVLSLQRRGHVVKVLTSRHGLTTQEDNHQEGVTRTLYLQTDLNYYRPINFFLRRSSDEKANIRELRTITERFQPDIIMIWGMWNLSLALPYWAEKLMPGRVVYYIASYWPTDVDPHTAYWNLPGRHWITELVKRPLRSLALYQLRKESYPPPLNFTHSLCMSQFVRENLVNAGKLPKNADVVYGGTDPTPFLSFSKKYHSNGFRLRLLYFGRLIYDKGVHTAIEALGWLERQGLANNVELTILGDGHPEYKQYLYSLVEKVGVKDRVTFLGRISRNEIPEWLSRFDVFIFSSIWPEPFGRTIVEAMMARLVVIGADVGGSREIFKAYDESLLFPPGDYKSLANRILRLINEPELLERLANEGQQLAIEHFSFESMIDKIEKYLDLIVVD